MPTASAKIEKIASVEAVDPVKQMVMLMEKKVRNLEKRKLKLDNYKSDVHNGKELNEDQKIAVSKYDAVVELLEYSKELSKACNGIIQEYARQQKKLAKKEQIEKQQLEIHRLHEIFSIKYVLERLECKEVNSDFLNGENGAIKLASEDLAHLSMLYKLIEPSLPNEQADVESHFHSLAEHFVFLLEGKNKEVVGTTCLWATSPTPGEEQFEALGLSLVEADQTQFVSLVCNISRIPHKIWLFLDYLFRTFSSGNFGDKHLKDILQSIKDCGYFSRTSAKEEEEVQEEDEEEEEEEEEETIDVVEGVSGLEENQNVSGTVEFIGNPVELSSVANGETHAHILSDADKVQGDEGSEISEKSSEKSLAPRNSSFSVQNGSLQDVLSAEGSFNFLQESQIDLESPHMDPAVVAVHQIAPPPTVNFSSYTAPQSCREEEIATRDVVDPCELPAQAVQQQMPVLASARTITPLLASVTQHSSPQEFDPSHPIPTQTFTNQSYAVMQNMLMPSAYVPAVTMHHGPIPPHIAPIAVVPGLPPVTGTDTTTPTVPLHVTVAPVPGTTTVPAIAVAKEELKISVENIEIQAAVLNGNTSGNETDGSHETPADRGNDSEGSFTTPNNYHRGGFRGRGRARAPFYRGRNNYNGSRGGGYQGHNSYYQTGFRRPNTRGPRGPINSRGRGGAYRSQQSSQQQQSQPHTQKQQ